MALNSLYCADVPLSNYSLTHFFFWTHCRYGRWRIVIETVRDVYRFTARTCNKRLSVVCWQWFMPTHNNRPPVLVLILASSRLKRRLSWLKRAADAAMMLSDRSWEHYYYYYYKSKDLSDASQKVAGALYKVIQSALCRSHWQSKSRQKLSVTGTTTETNEPWLHVEKPSVMRQPWSVEADNSKPVLQPRETRDRPE